MVPVNLLSDLLLKNGKVIAFIFIAIVLVWFISTVYSSYLDNQLKSQEIKINKSNHPNLFNS